MIIVEGADKVGKSTLCKLLAEKLGHEVVPFGLLPPDWDFFWDYVKRAGVNKVWDRGWLSEIAYCQATGRKLAFLTPQRIKVQQMLRLYGCVNVCVTAEPHLLYSRLQREPDDKFNNGVVMAANDWYINNHMYYDQDVHIHCSVHPFPTDYDVAMILDKYNRARYAFDVSVKSDFCLTRLSA